MKIQEQEYYVHCLIECVLCQVVCVDGLFNALGWYIWLYTLFQHYGYY